jgi:hypothetical protein
VVQRVLERPENCQVFRLELAEGFLYIQTLNLLVPFLFRTSVSRRLGGMRGTATQAERRHMMETHTEVFPPANKDLHLKPIRGLDGCTVIRKVEFQEVLKQIAVGMKIHVVRSDGD